MISIKELKVLFVEDSEDDTLLEVLQIKRGGYYVSFERVDNAQQMSRALSEKQWDIVLSDYSMPNFNGIKALELLRETGIDLPFIIISGTIGEEVAVEAMRKGANDYLMKNNLKRLVPAIERELQEAKIRADRLLLEKKKKQAEESLRESEERYRIIAQNTADTITLLDLDLKIVYVSPSVKKLRGYTVSESINTPLSQYLTPPSYQQLKDCIDTCFLGLPQHTNTSSNSILLELEQIHKNGFVIQTESSFSIISDVEFRPVNVLAITRDISERKRHEKELIEAKKQAEESDRLKTAFLQNMSHEIRTPLNAIMGFSTLLDMPDITEFERNQFITNIKKSGEALLFLINEIMDISKIQTNQLFLNNKLVIVLDLFIELKEFYTLLVSSKNIEFSIEMTNDLNLLSCFADPIRLKQILSNLINNALKFTENGYIKIGAFSQLKGYLTFFVEDTGIGIPETLGNSIFERFFKFGNSSEKLYDGLGLGLSISKNLVEAMGGNIWYVSKEKVGTTFFFTIPIL